MHIGNIQLLLIGGIIGAIAVSSISDSLVRRAAALLNRDIRERIWDREAMASLWWRAPDTVGVILIVAGLLKQFGILRIHTAVAWGIPTMAIGLTVVCASNALRAWLSRHYYASEAPGTPASRSALTAALLVSFAEIGLAAVVCWVVFAPMVSKASAAPPVVVKTVPADPPAEEAAWIDRAEGVQMLKGKDANYFEALVRWDNVRTKTEGGRTLYCRQDLVTRKQAGLPSEEELKDVLKQIREESQPPETAH